MTPVTISGGEGKVKNKKVGLSKIIPKQVLVVPKFKGKTKEASVLESFYHLHIP